MKKSLYKKLVRMARDGDAEAIEAVAEIVEDLTDPEAVIVEPVAAAPAVPAAIAPAPAAAPADPAVAIETPEGTEIVADEVTLSDIAAKLDQLITLLTPAAADEDPVEEIAEAVEEALEAAETAEEVPAAVPEAAAEIAEIVEEIVAEGEASSVLQPDAECEDPDQQVVASDMLRTALRVIAPDIRNMTGKERRKLADKIAARMRSRQADDAVSAVSRGTARPRKDPAELGKRIMEKRNPNYKK